MKRYQMSINAEDLRGSSCFGRVSPFASVEITGGPMEGKKLGRTETVSRCHEPDWVTILFVEAAADVNVPFTVSVYDDKGEEDKHRLIGTADFEVTIVYESPGHVQSEKLSNSGGNLFVQVEESVKGDSTGFFHFHFRGLDMKNVEPGLFGLGRSDPFFEISKKNADHTAGVVRWNVIYRSRHLNDTLNPYWNPGHIGLEELCYGQIDWPLKITVYDWNENGSHRIIGEFETNIEGLQERISIKGNADRDQAIPLFKSGKNKTKGLLVVLRAELELDEDATS